MSFLTQLQISARFKVELLTFLNSWRGKVQQSLALTQFNSLSCVSDSEQKHTSDRTPHGAIWPLAFASFKCNWCRSPVLPSEGLEHCAEVWGAGRFMYVTLGFYGRGLQWPGGVRCPPVRQSANPFWGRGSCKWATILIILFRIACATFKATRLWHPTGDKWRFVSFFLSPPWLFKQGLAHTVGVKSGFPGPGCGSTNTSMCEIPCCDNLPHLLSLWLLLCPYCQF